MSRPWNPSQLANQGRWKWHHSIDCVWFPISVLLVTVPKMHRFWNIRLQKCRDLENRLSGPSTSLKMSSFNSAYDFLLTFHCNHEPISYRFRDKRRFQSKIAKFSHPSTLRSRWRGSPWNWVTALRVKKGLPGRQWSLTISSAIWIEYTNVTDGRTPGQSKDRAYP